MGGPPAQAGSARRRNLNPHRSRGEALVRLSIPNVLRCLEFFFPDRRYLCRAARGSLFCGEESYRTAIAGVVLGEATCAWLAGLALDVTFSCMQLTGIRRTLF